MRRQDRVLPFFSLVRGAAAFVLRQAGNVISAGKAPTESMVAVAPALREGLVLIFDART